MPVLGEVQRGNIEEEGGMQYIQRCGSQGMFKWLKPSTSRAYGDCGRSWCGAPHSTKVPRGVGFWKYEEWIKGNRCEVLIEYETQERDLRP